MGAMFFKSRADKHGYNELRLYYIQVSDTDDMLTQCVFAHNIQVGNRRTLAGLCHILSAPTPNTVPLQYFIVGNRHSNGSYIGPNPFVGA